MIEGKNATIDQFVSYEQAIELMKSEVDHVLSDSPRMIRDYTQHLMGARGKMIRATSLLICAENNEGMVDQDAVKCAAAIEIVHLATLVHDDVIDNADVRRGILSLQKKYGKRIAVICGDYLLCTALRLVGAISNKQKYMDYEIQDYMSQVCLGELNECQNHDNLDLTVYEYLKIIAGKTAALFEASFHGGAVFGTKDKAEIKRYRRLGRYIGMIFQLTDDCLDYQSTAETAKKPVESDYEQGVITLPLIYTLQANPSLRAKAENKQALAAEVKREVLATGGIEYTRAVSRKYYEKSLQLIEQLDINEKKKSRMIYILDKAFGQV